MPIADYYFSLLFVMKKMQALGILAKILVANKCLDKLSKCSIHSLLISRDWIKTR